MSSLCLICPYFPVFFFNWTIIFLNVLLTNAPRTFISSEVSTQTSAPYLRVDRYLSFTKSYLSISGRTSAQHFVTVYVVMTGKQPYSRRRKGVCISLHTRGLHCKFLHCQLILIRLMLKLPLIRCIKCASITTNVRHQFLPSTL